MDFRVAGFSMTNGVWVITQNEFKLKGDYTELAIRERISGQQIVQPQCVPEKAVDCALARYFPSPGVGQL